MSKSGQWKWVSVAALAAVGLTLAACSNAGNGSGESGEAATASFEFKFASGNPETASPSRAVLEWFDIVTEEAADAGYEVVFDQYFNGSLMPSQEVNAGLSGGVVDSGVFSAFYSPSEFPLAQMSTVPFLASNPVAAAMTHAQMYEENDAYRAEFDKQNIVPVLWDSLPNVSAGFTEPLTTLAEFQGKKVRSAGFTASAFEAVDAVPVTLPIADTFEGLDRGVVDGFSSVPLDGAAQFSLQEPAPNFVDPQLGQYTQQAAMAFNKDVWDGLPEDLQQIMLDASAQMYAGPAAAIILDDGNKACEKVKAAGGDVTPLSEADVEKWKDLLGDSLQESWVDSVVAAGSSEDDARSYLADFQAAYAEKEKDVPPSDALAECAKG